MAAETTTDTLYQALSSPEPDPRVVHAAIEEVRDLSGQNVIATIGAQIAELRAEMKAGFAEVNARIDAQDARIDAQGARIDAQTSRIDVLQQVIWRVIWPLIILLAVPIFGLLYKALTTG